MNRFASLPTLLRLTFCVLISTGVHAAAVLYVGMEPLAVLSEDGKPVAVAFVSIDDISGVRPTTKSSKNEESAPLEKPALAKQVRAATPERTRPLRKPAKVVKQMLQPEQDVPVQVDPCVETVLPENRVCNEPRDDVAEITSTENLTFASFAEETPHLNGPDVENEVIASAPVGTEKGHSKGSKEELTEAVPRYRVNPKPEYPYVAARRRWEGVVWLLVDVSPEGLVSDLKVEQSCGYGVLDRAASNSVMRWKFVPAKRAGLPVASQVRIPVRFRLEDG